MIANDSTVKALAASLNMRELRQKIIAANVANADTPDYKAKKLDFEDALKRAIDLDKDNSLATEDTRHFDVGGGGFNNLKPEIYNDPNGVVSEDGNTVDRDDELAQMAQNKILYDASIQLLNKKLGMMRYTITNER
jgi:flagellar basal-body rod protein FlgB